METKLHIKNMFCRRCISAVEELFCQAGIETTSVALGEVLVRNMHPDDEQMARLGKSLLEHGFEIVNDRKSRLLEQIKATVIDVIHHQEHYELKINWSAYLSEKLNYDYNYLGNLFSAVNGITLERYIMRQKIEKIKEYLFYDELSLKEIAYKLGYSNQAHVSSQFKKMTGLTPSEYKKSKQEMTRTPLDSILEF